MKQAFGIFTAILLMPAFQVQAWVGGPWSNNSHQTNGDDGIYEAIATTANGIGMYRWAVQNTLDSSSLGPLTYGSGGGFQNSNVQFGGLIGAISPHVWYFRGLVYYGRCFGIVNSMMGLVSVVGNASDTGTDGAGIPINGVNLAGGLNNTLDFSGTGSTTTAVSSRKSFANSYFRAKLTRSGPVKRFSGKGKVSFIGLDDFILLSVRNPSSLTVTGDADFINATLVSQTPVSIGGSDEFDQQGVRFRFKVFGTQVSLNPAG